jgi:hypothetical protein
MAENDDTLVKKEEKWQRIRNDMGALVSCSHRLIDLPFHIFCSLSLLSHTLRSICNTMI